MFLLRTSFEIRSGNAAHNLLGRGQRFGNKGRHILGDRGDGRHDDGIAELTLGLGVGYR